jgi:5'-deoxynucleotidase YfbR-like HD superfamily hydrolase
MHDIGEYEFGDIPKPLRKKEHEDNEKNAIKRLNMVGSIMNSEQLRSFSNPQETICNYWKSFSENKSSDINVTIAHEIDVLECLLQLHNYKKNEANKISDFDQFKSDLEERINNPIVDSLARLLLGKDKYK